MTTYQRNIGAQPISNLQGLTLSAVAGSSNVTFTISADANTVDGVAVPNLIGLGDGWVDVEFNVFGSGNGNTAYINLNAGPATIQVQTEVETATHTTNAPSCVNTGTTGAFLTAEKNSLNLVPNCCLASGGDAPSITYLENTSGDSCTICGGEGQTCCTVGSGCNSSSDVCFGGMCTACGGSGDVCCSTANGGSACGSGYTCQEGSCGVQDGLTVDPDPVVLNAGDSDEGGTSSDTSVYATGAWASDPNVAPSVTCSTPEGSGVSCSVTNDINPPTLTFTADTSATSTTAKVCGTLSGVTVCTTEIVTVNACQPLICGSVGAGATGWVCGSFDNGCGKTVSCGRCESGETCTSGTCHPTCVTRACASPETWNPVTCECQGGCACGYLDVDGRKVCAVCR